MDIAVVNQPAFLAGIGIPPPRIALSEWIEGNIKLPEGVRRCPERFTMGGTSL
ncbi:hypothetical protein GWG65_34720 [Bradyrhizobium sp. CSA207]|uniref:hypothetical protein n=1 Tax=Bradyrhizobium sp. CSA207 TaxID=2698826 RepID=UPI0023B1F32F|nr:hypothetical protein [Bradyrhizobium sp. CSA207]MDE5446427.1 hypothetical protein [Bradyrhizobium sp. CSA207]